MSEKKYMVLARKYRPQTFDDLIGQEVLVRTLTNAIKSGKLAQSYILTGIRGIGKTTSARIIAKALNCIGTDGKGGATPHPCGECEHCRAIAEDRHVDVQEIDAASNTGVENAREIIEGTRYNPASARYKIYIIDEVHMLSKSAFNALLKTLEEPPEKVKFIFATTEIRKVPVTVLSRCQRFDLRRIDEVQLASHYANIASKEGVEIEEDALNIIARCADGSARDGLSLLDQAIALSEGKITAEAVREMIGISSKEAVLELYEALLHGAADKALESFRGLYGQGYDPVAVIQDLLNLTHLITKVKIGAAGIAQADLSDNEKTNVDAIAAQVGMPILAMFWQMLLKGIDEIKIAPSALQAAEMILVRMCYLQGTPPTADTIDRIKNASRPHDDEKMREAAPAAPPSAAEPRTNARLAPVASISSVAGTSALDMAPKSAVSFASINDVAAYAAERTEMALATAIRNDMRVVKFAEGIIEFIPVSGAEENLSYRLAKKLLEWTDRRWVVDAVTDGTALTIKEQELEAERDFTNEVTSFPLVAGILTAFPGARITSIEKLEDREEYEKEDKNDEYDGNDETGAKPAEKD